jgi:hypothetical protein
MTNIQAAILCNWEHGHSVFWLIFFNRRKGPAPITIKLELWKDYTGKLLFEGKKIKP